MRLVLGTLRLTGTFNDLFFEPRRKSESRRFLFSALDAGFSAFDTAPVYGRGTAEVLLGQTLPGDAAVFTKVGVDIAGSLPTIDFSVSGMKASLSGSLRRLNREQIDTLYIHNPPPSVLRQDSIYEFLEWARIAGVAKEYGISFAFNRDLSQLLERRAISVICIQPPRVPRALRMPHGVKLALRSIFEGGELARGAGTIAIQRRVSNLIEHHAPANVIVGPRISRHLPAYSPWLTRT